MKALFHRFNRGLSKDKDRDVVVPPKDSSRDDTTTATTPKEKILQLPPLPEWPPPTTRVMSTPTSISSYKPLPDIAAQRPLPSIGEPAPSTTSSDSSGTHTARAAEPSVRSQDSNAALNVSTRTTLPRSDPEPMVRSPSRKTMTGSVNTTTATVTTTEPHKKVAFKSPPPTPAGSEKDRQDGSATPTNNGSTPGALSKTTVSRFQAAHGKEPRGSTSTAASASASKVDISSAKVTTTSNKATSTRTAASPYPASIRSGTPYSQMSNNSSRILAAASWSEGAEDDLVSNLGPRERTRQEVLWEIVASEERYVGELVKMRDTFIEPLLHPYSSTVASPTSMEYDDYSRYDSPLDSADQLPIASRFMSPTGFRPETPISPPGTSHSIKNDKDKQSQTPNIDGESLDTDEEEEGGDRVGQGYPNPRKGTSSQASKHNHPRSPYRSTATKMSLGGKIAAAVPFPSRSHHSLPPPPRNNPNSSTHSLGRQSSFADRERERNNSTGQASLTERKATPTQGARVLRKFRRSETASDVILNGAVAPHLLPDDLRICLEVVESGILDGHHKLSEGLRKRYEEQYPLVRSLADVFVSNSHIFQGYATYVLHLERALEQVDNGLSTAGVSKKPKNQDSADWLKVCKYLQKLEQSAADKGETGLAISLSKPFQRLLKYPLLFQNLLFHTDPSTFEYESTLQMVAEVETIVRSIEDEKIQKEDRDKTRDVFARIEGLDKVKQLAVPKPSRMLVEERQLMSSAPPNGSPKSLSPPPVTNKAVKGKTSFKRLSDVLQSGSGVGGKKDIWLVVFNDVVLRCQRTGTTSLPLVAATNSRTTSLPELQSNSKSKYASNGRRSAQIRPRNMYKFLKIETWVIGDVVQPREGVVSMEDVARSRAQVHSGLQPKIVPLPDDDEDGGESDDSDKKSKMSFSYWGADKVTIQKPVIRPRQSGALATARRASPGGSSSYGRESSANAKFGTRLVSGESPSSHRPASRRTQGTPTSRRPPISDDGQSAKATVTRPAWDSSPRSPIPTPVPAKRTRNISQTSAATRTPINNSKLSSPAPSEDSGVGMYRQMMAQDPSLNH